MIDASWRSEGMAVLAWALGCADLPAVYVECNPSDVADTMGFLLDLENTVLESPKLRSPEEIEIWADTYLTLHRRLRQYSLRPEQIDFVNYVSKCNWARLLLDHLETQDQDLAINSVRIDKVEPGVFRHTLSIARERHTAFNWLLGFEKVYSEVTADT